MFIFVFFDDLAAAIGNQNGQANFYAMWPSSGFRSIRLMTCFWIFHRQKWSLIFLPLSSYSSRTHFSVRDRCPHIVFLAFGLVEPPLLVWQIDSFTTHVILFNNSYERQTIMVIAKHVVHQWFSPSHVHLYEFWINNLYISHLPLSKFIEVTETSKYLDCLLGRIHDLRRTAKWRKLKTWTPQYVRWIRFPYFERKYIWRSRWSNPVSLPATICASTECLISPHLLLCCCCCRLHACHDASRVSALQNKQNVNSFLWLCAS